MKYNISVTTQEKCTQRKLKHQQKHTFENCHLFWLPTVMLKIKLSPFPSQVAYWSRCLSLVSVIVSVVPKCDEKTLREVLIIPIVSVVPKSVEMTETITRELLIVPIVSVISKLRQIKNQKLKTTIQLQEQVQCLKTGFPSNTLLYEMCSLWKIALTTTKSMKYSNSETDFQSNY